MAQEIMILAEVEKIWILYDVCGNGTLLIKELQDYLNEVAFSQMSLSEEETNKIFEEIDKDGDGTITKDEMFLFLMSLITSGNFNFQSVTRTENFKKS